MKIAYIHDAAYPFEEIFEGRHEVDRLETIEDLLFSDVNSYDAIFFDIDIPYKEFKDIDNSTILDGLAHHDQTTRERFSEILGEKRGPLNGLKFALSARTPKVLGGFSYRGGLALWSTYSLHDAKKVMAQINFKVITPDEVVRSPNDIYYLPKPCEIYELERVVEKTLKYRYTNPFIVYQPDTIFSIS